MYTSVKLCLCKTSSISLVLWLVILFMTNDVKVVYTGQKAHPSGIKKNVFALVFQLGMSFETKD